MYLGITFLENNIMKRKIKVVHFIRGIQLGNECLEHITDYSYLDGRPVRIVMDEGDERFLRVEWKNHEQKSMVNLVPWAAVSSIVIEEEIVEPKSNVSGTK